MGAATVRAKTEALAPSQDVEIVTAGGAMFGY